MPSGWKGGRAGVLSCARVVEWSVFLVVLCSVFLKPFFHFFFVSEKKRTDHDLMRTSRYNNTWYIHKYDALLYMIRSHCSTHYLVHVLHTEQAILYRVHMFNDRTPNTTQRAEGDRPAAACCGTLRAAGTINNSDVSCVVYILRLKKKAENRKIKNRLNIIYSKTIVLVIL